MAKCGFYEIRTFETLSRDYGTGYASFDVPSKETKTIDQVGNDKD
jgi:hypothetical protein